MPDAAARAPAPLLRVGIVGAGENTRRRHIPGLRAIPGVELVSVCNRTRASAERVAREFGIPAVYDRWADLVAAPDTDAVVIGTWPCLHAPVTLAALAAGRHVLCEARMAMNAPEAHAMLRAARARPDLTAQLVPAPFTLGVDRTVRRLIGEGFLGELLTLEVRMHGAQFLDPRAPLHWRQDERKSGLNAMGLGIWYESVMRWVGPASSVVALGQTFVPERLDPDTGALRRVEIPEHLDVLAGMACGLHAAFSFSAVTGLAPADEVVLCGSEGTLRFAAGELTGARRGAPALRPVPIPAAERGGWRVEEEFVNAVRGREPVTRTTFEDGVRYMEFTEAAALSRAEGRAVALPLPAEPHEAAGP